MLHANNTDEILEKCREDTKKKPGKSGEYLKGCSLVACASSNCSISVSLVLPTIPLLIIYISRGVSFSYSCCSSLSKVY